MKRAEYGKWNTVSFKKEMTVGHITMQVCFGERKGLNILWSQDNVFNHYSNYAIL